MTATTHIPYRLDGKVALVTGSGRGIGAAMAVELGRLGAKVAVNYANSHEPAEKIVQGIKKLGTDAIALQANIRNASEIVKVMDDANAGVVSFGHLGDVTEEEFDRVFGLNTRDQFFVAREAYRLNTHDRIILMSSNTAKEFSVRRHSVYSRSIVRVMAKDCGDKHYCQCCCPRGNGDGYVLRCGAALHYIPNGEKYTRKSCNEWRRLYRR